MRRIILPLCISLSILLLTGCAFRISMGLYRKTPPEVQTMGYKQFVEIRDLALSYCNDSMVTPTAVPIWLPELLAKVFTLMEMKVPEDNELKILWFDLEATTKDED